MDIKSVAQAVSKFAPALGTALLGAPGAPLGAAVASLFGASPDDPNLANLIATNPEAAVKLKEFETQLELAKIAQQNNEVNAEIADRESARNMGTEEAKIPWNIDNIVKGALAFGIIGILIACVLIAATMKLDLSSEQLLHDIANRSYDVILMVAAYYWGSSVSSRRKDELMYGKKS